MTNKEIEDRLEFVFEATFEDVSLLMKELESRGVENTEENFKKFLTDIIISGEIETLLNKK